MVIAKDITEYSKLRIQNTVDKALPLTYEKKYLIAFWMRSTYCSPMYKNLKYIAQL